MPTSDTMDQRNRAPDRRRFVAHVVRELTKYESWCGETHVQKALFYLRTLFERDAGFNFHLHYHGPFSADVSETLQFMVGYGEIAYEPQPPYRPHIRLTDAGESMPESRAGDARIVEWVAQQLGSKGVDALEGPATATLLRSQRRWEDDDLAREINRLKKHISLEDARVAIAEAKRLEAEAESFRCVSSSRRAANV